MSVHFLMNRAHTIDPAKLEVVNRLMRLVSHYGLAFFVMLADKDLIS